MAAIISTRPHREPEVGRAAAAPPRTRHPQSSACAREVSAGPKTRVNQRGKPAVALIDLLRRLASPLVGRRHSSCARSIHLATRSGSCRSYGCGTYDDRCDAAKTLGMAVIVSLASRREPFEQGWLPPPPPRSRRGIDTFLCFACTNRYYGAAGTSWPTATTPPVAFAGDLSRLVSRNCFSFALCSSGKRTTT